jgi:hypothetical protein
VQVKMVPVNVFLPLTMSGRRIGRQLLLDVEGRRLYAARIIMRAIIRYQYSKRFRRVIDKWRVEQSAILLVECEEEKQNLLEDIEDIDIDIEQLRRYIKRFQFRLDELKFFRKETQLRIPQVEAELDDLGIEEIEGGMEGASLSLATFLIHLTPPTHRMGGGIGVGVGEPE